MSDRRSRRSGTPIATGTTRGPFVGRAVELASLERRLEAARSGSGAIVLLDGEAGVGKTRLVEEFAARAAVSLGPERVLSARCREDLAPAFAAWSELLAHPTLAPGATADHEPREGAPPTLAALVGQHASVRGPSGTRADEERLRLFHDVLAALTAACGAAPQPLLLILDDLQWADRSSLRLLEFVGGELRRLPLLILAVGRSVDASVASPLLHTVANLLREPETTRLTLDGLSVPDVRQLLGATTGQVPSADLVSAIHDRTNGNAFFVVELVRAVASADNGVGALPEHVSELPSSVQDVIAARVNRLSARGRHVLSVAAVLGAEFELRTLVLAAELTSDEVAAALVEAEVAGFVRPLLSAPGGFAFTHDIVREARYQALPTAGRMRIHRQCADAVESAHGSGDGPHLAEAARHLALAIPLVDPHHAAEYARRAAEWSLGAMGYEDAADHFESALRLLTPSPGGGAGAAERARVLVALAHARRLAGDADGAREAYRECAQLADRLRDGALLADCALGYGAVGFADVWLASGFVDHELIAMLRAALALAPGGDGALRARLLGRLATALYYAPEREERRPLAREALAMARRIGDRDALAFALTNLCWALWGPDDLAERGKAGRELLSLAEEMNDPPLLIEAHHLRIARALELGDAAELRRAVAAQAALAERTRQPFRRYGTAVAESMCALMAGRFAEAEALAEQFLELGKHTQPDHAIQSYVVTRLMIRRHQGRAKELVPTVEAAVEQFPTVAGWRCVLALLYADVGNREGALDLLRPLAERDFVDVPRDWCWIVAMACAAETSVLTRELEIGRRVEAQLAALPEVVIVVADGVACFGTLSYYRGLLAAARQDRDEAMRQFDRAIATCRELDARPYLALVQVAAARELLRAESAAERERGAELLDEGVRSARALGMTRLVRESRWLAESPRRRRRSRAHARELHDGFGLTTREREVLSLIAAGRSNNEIAAELVISPHTAVNHTKRILAKMGAANRAEATALAIRHGLAGSETPGTSALA